MLFGKDPAAGGFELTSSAAISRGGHMDFFEVLKNRRSVRKFQDKPVPEEIIRDILRGAALAPETDTCRYYFGVVKDRHIRNELGKAAHFAQWISSAPVIFACCCDISWDIGKQKEDDYGVVGNTLRYNAEIVEFLRKHHDRKACKTLILATPVYIAAQHIILTAVSHGLRGCLVDFIRIARINEILGLPENIACQVLVPVGYPGEEPVKRESGIDKKIFYNTWS